jgi:hypothetical protein
MRRAVANRPSAEHFQKIRGAVGEEGKTTPEQVEDPYRVWIGVLKTGQGPDPWCFPLTGESRRL